MARHAHRIVVAFVAAPLFAGSALAPYSGGGLWGKGTTGDVVKIENADTGVTREETLTEDGKWRFERIPVGVYTVTITHQDGTTETKKARVALGTNTYVK